MIKIVYIGNRPKIFDNIVLNKKLKLVKGFIIDQPLIQDSIEYNIERIPPKGKKKYLVDSLLELDYDICVSAGCSYILPMKVIDSKGIYINCHPSVLPLGKGIHPLNECFFSGNNIAGVTIHLLVNELDAGDILNQRSFELTPEVDLSLLYGFIFDMEAELLEETISSLIINEMRYKAIPQTGISSYYSREKEIRKFDVRNTSVKEILRNVRAFSSAGLGVVLILNDIKIIVFLVQEIVNEFVIKRYEKNRHGTLIFMNNDVALIKASDGFLKVDKFRVYND